MLRGLGIEFRMRVQDAHSGGVRGAARAPSVRPSPHPFIRSTHVPHRTDFDSQMDTQVPRT